MADAAVTSPHATFELVIGGMTCAACAARVQGKLNKLEGVTATVNFATGRARVTAPPEATAPDLIRVVAAAGYTAELPAPAAAGPASATDDQAADRGAAADDAAVRRLRGRLILALIFFVPLTDASIVLSLFTWARFPGWQWCLVALALPVATWAAWPFHQAALRNARHRSASMDTLVSLGILAACGWSVYAMFVLDRGRSELSGLQNLVHGSGGGIYLEVAASVTTFLLAGRLYEARARRTAGQAMRDLAAAGARDVCVLGDDGAEQRIPAGLLAAGQRFVVRPGERIAADGQVLSGRSAVDRSMMTGESVPVDAAEGDAVTGGTIVLTGRLVVRADQVGPDTQLAHLITMVEQAQARARHPAAGRPGLRGVRAVRAGLLGPDAGRMAAGGQCGRARLQRRLGRADHRLPVRARAGHPGGPGRGLGPRRPARHLHQGLPGAGGFAGDRHRRAGQDGNRHHRADDGHRGAWPSAPAPTWPSAPPT